MCKVIAVANQKGGVGKTVTSVNLGIGLDILPGNIELSGLEISLIGVISRETILRQYVNKAR